MKLCLCTLHASLCQAVQAPCPFSSGMFLFSFLSYDLCVRSVATYLYKGLCPSYVKQTTGDRIFDM